MELQPLAAEHLEPVLEFETVNRDYFARTVPDRGDEYFANYPTRHALLLELQRAGTDYFHLLVDDDGAIAGRINLIEVSDGEAELGFRIGERFARAGHATEGVRQVCALARTYGLSSLRAFANVSNIASRKALDHNGFIQVGEKDGTTAYQLRL